MTNIELSILSVAAIATVLAIIAFGAVIRLREDVRGWLREKADGDSLNPMRARHWALDAKVDALQAHLGVRVEEVPPSMVVRLLPPK